MKSGSEFAMSSEEPRGSAGDRLLLYTLPPLALAGGLGAFELLRGRYQRSQVFLPSRYPTGIWDPSLYGLPFVDAWFESEDGLKLHGWWVEYPKALATVIYCHGNSGSIADRIDVFRQLRRLKINIFAFDYRGYGRSAGEPSEKGLFQDVRAACDYVTRELGVDFSELLLFGHSLGGAVAVDGAMHRPVAGLVVQSSFTDLRDMVRYLYPNFPMHLVIRNEFRSIAKVGKLTMPKLFLHGTEDGAVPFALGQRLYEAAADPKSWHPVANAGHNDIYLHGGMRYFRALSKFRKRCLGH